MSRLYRATTSCGQRGLSALRPTSTWLEIHIATGVAPEGDTFSDWDGTRAAALDWYAAFATYRRDIERAIDLGERVLSSRPIDGY